MTQLEYFRILAPEFAAVPDVEVLKWLVIAGTLVNVGCLTPAGADMATALYAAHMLALATTAASTGSTGGGLKREKEGDLEREYFQANVGGGALGQTSYGQQYNQLTIGCVGSAIMTRGPILGPLYPGY